MSFQRARSEEQRAERRRAILEAAATMLAEMPVADVSLNELSRRAGLAKPNVVRYFESREAILLELLDAEVKRWLERLDAAPPAPEGTVRERGDALSETLVASLVESPVLCDLVTSQAAVLERNVSAQVAIRHKQAANAASARVVDLVRTWVPELDEAAAWEVVTVLLFSLAGSWPHARPSQALLDAYASDPTLGVHRVDVADYVRRTVQVTISGLLARAGAVA